MNRFYFTYGSSGQPFVGGWTVIEAENMEQARRIFRAIYPDKTPGIMNFSDCYTEEQFVKSSMYRNGNLGYRCHEIITVSRRLTKEVENE